MCWKAWAMPSSPQCPGDTAFDRLDASAGLGYSAAHSATSDRRRAIYFYDPLFGLYLRWPPGRGGRREDA